MGNIGDQSMESSLADAWWYYTVEHKPEAFYQGIYRDDMVLLPRRNLSMIDLTGQRAIDVCTMEGLIPTLMAKGGASEVYATDNARPSDYPDDGNDSLYYMRRKVKAVRQLHNVDWNYEIIPEKTGVFDHLSRMNVGQFDVLNLSGLLYHVYSPMHWLGAVRPLIKDGGLVIISTNIKFTDEMSMFFNAKGYPQNNLTTYWYPSVPLFDYMLRYFRLMPVRALSFRDDDGFGYVSAVCRATENVIADPDDSWMEPSAWHSWDSKWFGGLNMAGRSEKSSVKFKDGKADQRISLADATELQRHGHSNHTAVLKLGDIE